MRDLDAKAHLPVDIRGDLRQVHGTDTGPAGRAGDEDGDVGATGRGRADLQVREMWCR